MKDLILQALPGDFPWQNQIHWFDSIDSTNTRAKEMALRGAPHGTVLIADHQTGGRGRMGRSFLSPSGVGIYMSVLLRPHCPPEKLMHLTCATAVAMCVAVERSAGFRPGIKWTNDLVSGCKKLAGILTEMALDASSQIAYAVVGIGINCCQRADDFAPEIRDMAGSLTMIAGTAVSRPKVAGAMLEALLRMDRNLLSGKDSVMTRYRKDCITVGRELSLVRGDEIRHGLAVDVDEAGALVVRFDDGHVETVNSGEVSVRGLYGYV